MYCLFIIICFIDACVCACIHVYNVHVSISVSAHSLDRYTHRYLRICFLSIYGCVSVLYVYIMCVCEGMFGYRDLCLGLSLCV